jgi:hypothetical protein
VKRGISSVSRIGKKTIIISGNMETTGEVAGGLREREILLCRLQERRSEGYLTEIYGPLCDIDEGSVVIPLL